MSNSLLDQAREDETNRIIDALKGLNDEEQHVYLRAYGDALLYFRNFLTGEDADDVDRYLP